MTLDPYHFSGTPEDEPIMPGPEWTEPGWIFLPPPTLPLREHYGPGNHKSGSTQASHSKGGVGRATTGLQKGIAADGGASIRTSGMTPSTGYMVSYDAKSGHNVVIDTVNTPPAVVDAQVAAFVESNRAFVTSHADRYYGGWVDNGKLHLDVSQNFPPERRAQALAAGSERNQIAIFDLQTFDSIATGGTGG